MKSEEFDIKNKLFDISFEQDESNTFDYRSPLFNQSHTHRQRPHDDVSQWHIKSSRQVESTDNLQARQKESASKRTSLADSYALPRITTRSIYNSMSLNTVNNKPPVHSALLQDPPFSYFCTNVADYSSNEAVVLNKQKMKQTQFRVNTVYLKLAYQSPVSKIRSIIHNNPKSPTADGSFDIMKKIEKKKKQLELAGKLKESPFIHSKDYAKDAQKPFQRYAFERKVLDILQPERQHKRRSRRRKT